MLGAQVMNKQGTCDTYIGASYMESLVLLDSLREEAGEKREFSCKPFEKVQLRAQ
jgi:hypothetical protein